MKFRMGKAGMSKPRVVVARCSSGQGSVEFAIVTAGLLVIATACGLLWRALGSGLFVEHALSAASHHVNGAALGALSDVLLY